MAQFAAPVLGLVGTLASSLLAPSPDTPEPPEVIGAEDDPNAEEDLLGVEREDRRRRALNFKAPSLLSGQSEPSTRAPTLLGGGK